MGIEFAYRGKVKPKERPRIGRNRTFTPKATLCSEQDIVEQFKTYFKNYKVSDSAFSVIIRFYALKPKKPVHPYPSTCDLDNLIKTVFDAFNGVIWKDDRQIVQVLASKSYDVFDGFNMVIEELE